jgi:hypothetical protein
LRLVYVYQKPYSVDDRATSESETYDGITIGREYELLRDNQCYCRFAHFEFYMIYLGLELPPLLYEADDEQPELWFVTTVDIFLKSKEYESPLYVDPQAKILKPF